MAAGCTSLAVVVMHGHAAPALEDAIAAAARAAGFAHVTCSHEVAATPGLLARAETAVIDAYLTPIVAAELAALAAALPMATIEVMTSSGELVAAADARGRALVLSGPTVSASPSQRAIDPPPAAMVWMSSAGVRIHTRLFAIGDQVGAAGFVADVDDPAARPRCCARMLFG